MNTVSIGFPNLFDVSRNRVATIKDNASVANRVKLLLLTEPTELYMNTNFGVGLKRFMFQYNNDNVIAQIKDRLIEQLRLWEPSVDADKTTVVRGLAYSGQGPLEQTSEQDQLNLTITIYTIYGAKLDITLNGSQLEF